jgi:hypothetical protein
MHVLFQNKKVRCALLACGLLIAMMLACVSYFKIVDSNTTRYTYDIAGRLGYTESALLFANTYCWDIESECGKFIHFTTNKSFDEFEKDVERLNFTTRSLSPSGGFYVFNDINFYSERKLTLDGIDARGLANINMQAPTAWEWRLTDQNSEELTIRFYETAKHKAIYQIGDERIHGNIVTVMLKTR